MLESLNIDVMSILTTILITVFGLLVAIIGFWLKRFVAEVSKLREMLQEMMQSQSATNATCIIKHTGISEDIHELKKVTGKHSEQITRISTKIGME